jgi:hypothetical protein
MTAVWRSIMIFANPGMVLNTEPLCSSVLVVPAPFPEESLLTFQLI